MVWERLPVSYRTFALSAVSTNIIFRSFCMYPALLQAHENDNFASDLNKVFDAIGSEKIVPANLPHSTSLQTTYLRRCRHCL